MSDKTAAEIMAGMPTAARRKAERLLRSRPADWRVGECTAAGGADWILRLVDEKGQPCGAIEVHCSDEDG